MVTFSLHSLKLWVKVQMDYLRQKQCCPTVHVSSKIARVKWSYWNAFTMIKKQEDSLILQPLTSIRKSTWENCLSSWLLGDHLIALRWCRATWSIYGTFLSLETLKYNFEKKAQNLWLLTLLPWHCAKIYLHTRDQQISQGEGAQT